MYCLTSDMKLLSVILVISTVVVAFSAAVEHCPSTDIDSFCTCSHNTVKTNVVCRNIVDPQDLVEEIEKFQGYKIDALHLINLRVSYLPDGLFLGTSVKVLVFKDCELGRVYQTTQSTLYPFSGLEDSLEELGIYSTKIPSLWYWTNMKGLKKLKTIEIVQTPLDFVGHVFSEIGDGSLEKITVAYSQVNRIHPQGFPELTNLKEVNFAGNSLPYMVRTMFADPAPLLRMIDLSDNKLFTLPENMFDNMPALRVLDLSKNEFKVFISMPAYSWTLRQFYISENPFECGCHLKPLKRLLSSQLMHSDIKDVSCSRPNEQQKHLLKDIPDDEFGC